jgi:ribosomal protein L5
VDALLDYSSKEARLILLTKYRVKSVHDIASIKTLGLSLGFNKNKVEALTALAILTNNSKNYSFLKSKSSSGSRYTKFGSDSGYTLKYILPKNFIYFFITNLVYCYLPRIRYFKGFDSKNFNRDGNFSYTFKDLMIFPELEEELESFYRLSNLKLLIILNRKTTIKKSQFLFHLLGIPLLTFD